VNPALGVVLELNNQNLAIMAREKITAQKKKKLFKR